MENNKAFIATIGKISPIDGADKIEVATIYLNKVAQTQVVVGKNAYREGSLVVYFDSNLCLTEDFIEAIDKLNGANKETSVAKYLAKGNRVKTVKLRGAISDGLTIPIEKLKKLDSSFPEKEGYSFDKIKNMEVCHKWVPYASTSNNQIQPKQKSQIIGGQFNFHKDTDNLLRNLDKIDFTKIYSVTEKVHGTSSVASNILVKRNLSFLERIIKKLGIKIKDTEYKHIYSSRKQLKEFADEDDLWVFVGKQQFEGKLRQGESVYFEIIGYRPSGAFIQGPYDYGCKFGEYKIQVYRMTSTTPDGKVLEYSWQQVKDRCKEMGVGIVYEHYYGKLIDYIPIAKEEFFGEILIEELTENYLEKDCPFSKTKLPNEGVVLKEDSQDFKAFKLKSKRFLLKESELKEKDDYEDAEV